MYACSVEFAHIQTPVGVLCVSGSDKGIASIRFLEQEPQEVIKQPNNPTTQLCIDQLTEYFEGKRITFDSLQLHYPETDFQRDVWNALMKVPFGEVITYGELAERAGHKGAARAVGTAMNCNPLPIIIPCHRVLPSDKSIGAYAFGSHIKEWLLSHEGVYCRNRSYSSTVS